MINDHKIAMWARPGPGEAPGCVDVIRRDARTGRPVAVRSVTVSEARALAAFLALGTADQAVCTDLERALQSQGMGGHPAPPRGAR